MTTTSKPASQAATRTLVRGGASVALSTSTAVAAAAVAAATWPEGYSSSAPPSGLWRWTTCLSNNSVTRVPGAATRASTTASHRLTRQASAALASTASTTNGPTVYAIAVAMPSPQILMASCHRIISASAALGRRVRQTRAATSATTKAATTPTTRTHRGLSAGDQPS